MGGVWEVSISKANLISIVVNKGASSGRTCGEAEAREGLLLGDGRLCMTEARL